MTKKGWIFGTEKGWIFGTEAEISEEEYNKMVDEWVVERNKHKGESYKVQVGIWPPFNKCYETQNFEWVTTDLIRRYCDAISDYKNPLWRSEDYARNTRWGGIIAPPMFIDAIASTFVEPYLDLGLDHVRPPGIHGLPAGSTCRFFRVIRPGDRIHVIDTYMGIVEKHPDTHLKEKGYRLFLDVTRRTYINQRDEVVAYAESPLIRNTARPGGSITVSDAYLDRERPKYTKEYLDLIYRAYDEEKPRGAEPRYWEDVVVGEELQTIVAGPLDANDCAVYQGVIGFNGTFAYKYFWSQVQSGETHYPIDAVTGDYTAGARCHLDVPVGKGANRCIGWAGQAWGLLSRLVTNWMGDDGFLKFYATRMRRVWYFEETSWMKGKVARKYVEGNEHLVDLELHIETQDGFIYMTGVATVRLPSRAEV